TFIYPVHQPLPFLLQQPIQSRYPPHPKNHRILLQSLRKVPLRIFRNLHTKRPTLIPLVIPQPIRRQKVPSLLDHRF
ncbi:alanine--glyoxylate aminotransferase family protein, partial [Enterococcus faecalis]